MRAPSLLLLSLALSGCVNGQWRGPAINVSAGFDGVTVGLSLAGAATGFLPTARGILEDGKRIIKPEHEATAP